MSLLAVWPEIVERLDPDERDGVSRALIVPRLSASDEDLTPALEVAEAFDFVLIEGQVFKETTLASQSALELLGPGDVLAPLVTGARQLELRGASRYLGLGMVSVAVLGARFERLASLRPQVSRFLHDRIAEQAHRASLHLAMLHLPRAEDRILALFSDLADRFGRVSPDGILIDLSLSHEIIGRLTASRRPTVTIALRLLHEQGLLTRLNDTSWRLIAAPTDVYGLVAGRP